MSADANASGTRLSGTTESSIGSGTRSPTAYGRAYPMANGPAPNAVPQMIQRSWRRAVADAHAIHREGQHDEPRDHEQ